jgi:hypothetical protein
MKPVKGIESKCFGRRLRTSNGFEIHEAPWQVQTTESLNRSSLCVLHNAWSSFGGVISTAFPYATSCLAPVLEGGPEYLSVTGLLHSLSDRLQCLVWVALENLLSNLFQGPIPELVDAPYKQKSLLDFN